MSEPIRELDPDVVAARSDPAARERLLERCAPLVARIAARMGTRLPRHVEHAELVSAGTLGLLEALDRYDPSRGCRFEVFAVSRVRGAMLDAARSYGVVPRGVWARRRQVDRAEAQLAAELGRRPTSTEVAAATGLSVAAVEAAAGAAASEQDAVDERSVDPALLRALRDAGASRDPEQAAVDADARRRLWWALDRLPERSRHVVVWHYLDGLAFARIGALLGVTASRAAQLHTQALGLLRAIMTRM